MKVFAAIALCSLVVVCSGVPAQSRSEPPLPDIPDFVYKFLSERARAKPLSEDGCIDYPAHVGAGDGVVFAGFLVTKDSYCGNTIKTTIVDDMDLLGSVCNCSDEGTGGGCICYAIEGAPAASIAVECKSNKPKKSFISEMSASDEAAFEFFEVETIKAVGTDIKCVLTLKSS